MMLCVMKYKSGLIILIILCVVLGVATVYVKRQATEQDRENQTRIVNLSNSWSKASLDLEDARQTIASHERDMEKTNKLNLQAMGELSNQLAQVSTTLERTAASLKATETSLAAKETELKQTQTRVAELETANQDLDRQAQELSVSITNLTTQIAETRRKLESSEGDRAILERELQRMIGEKAEMERQFNDLAILRAQIRKLKEDANVARRLDWSRRGVIAASEQKGAQQLMQGNRVTQPKAASQNPDLNVEVSSEGTAKILSGATNAPAQK